jgi:hypothetical protein
MNWMKRGFFGSRATAGVMALVMMAAVSCSEKDDVAAPAAVGKYSNGFFVVNEGWFGHETGGVFFYDRSADSLVPNVYAKENPEKSLGKVSATLQYAAVFENKLYMVVKAGGPLVVCDANTMKETGRIDALPGNDGHSFVGINSETGLLGTGSGVYLVTLSRLAANAKLQSVTGYIGNMVKAGNNVFIASKDSGLVVINAGDYGFTKRMKGVTMGPVTSLDGKVWVTADSSLIGINPATLTTDTIKLPVKTYSGWGAWRSTSITTSTAENAVFIMRNASFSGGREIYKYVNGNKASVEKPFITLPEGQYSYGAAVGYDGQHNELIVTTLNGQFTGDVNRVLIYNAATGELKQTLTYTGWYFPAMTVFH